MYSGDLFSCSCTPLFLFFDIHTGLFGRWRFSVRWIFPDKRKHLFDSQTNPLTDSESIKRKASHTLKTDKELSEEAQVEPHNHLASHPQPNKHFHTHDSPTFLSWLHLSVFWTLCYPMSLSCKKKTVFVPTKHPLGSLFFLQRVTAHQLQVKMCVQRSPGYIWGYLNNGRIAVI